MTRWVLAQTWCRQINPFFHADVFFPVWSFPSRGLAGGAAFGVVSVERHPLFDDRQRRGHPAGCGSSTRLELHGWLGGEDLVDGYVVLLDACG
jgi:hypothetical protein